MWHSNKQYFQLGNRKTHWISSLSLMQGWHTWTNLNCRIIFSKQTLILLVSSTSKSILYIVWYSTLSSDITSTLQCFAAVNGSAYDSLYRYIYSGGQMETCFLNFFVFISLWDPTDMTNMQYMSVSNICYECIYTYGEYIATIFDIYLSIYITKP